ncbi:MAG: hypothetical protein COV70_00645 [Parcubacteria group bacterium CG11_big_fil_rev_8_21_14_0_20_39_22]|nr:MAG: hypothetical protein COV70_00645 [Parcubacteria group bacterium CG11_big_fil_rev_8_21_14_0_20_39_22]
MYNYFNQKTTEDFSPENVEAMYDQGFVFTRIGRGVMQQIRSVRIDLEKFDLTSENRRILRKVDKFKVGKFEVPYGGYDWTIGKLAKDFYDSRGADFSANKIKEILTSDKSNFNTLFTYTEDDAEIPLGYAICFETENILHYAYPFFDHIHYPKDTSMAMMLEAIEYAKKTNKKYIYLGSLSQYKTQFKGFEWFDVGDTDKHVRETRIKTDGEGIDKNEEGQINKDDGCWSNDIEKAKTVLTLLKLKGNL